MHDGKVVRHEVSPIHSATSPAFRQATGSLIGGSFLDGNNVTTLVNGREIFPAMLSAIRSARRSINFETYVFWDGEIAKQFAAALDGESPRRRKGKRDS
jgi:cardiolipin synthase